MKAVTLYSTYIIISSCMLFIIMHKETTISILLEEQQKEKKVIQNLEYDIMYLTFQKTYTRRPEAIMHYAQKARMQPIELQKVYRD